MANFDEHHESAGLTGSPRPRWRTPRLTSDSIGLVTGDDNPPGAPFDGLVSYGTSFHENS